MAGKSNKSQGGNSGKGSAGTGNPKTLKRKNQRKRASQSMSLGSTVPQGGGQTVRQKAPDTVRLLVSSRMELEGGNPNDGVARALNITPTQWAVEQIGEDGLTTNVAFTYHYQPDGWFRGLGRLFSLFRWVSLTLEWVPKASTVSEGELVVGQLLDVTDLIPARVTGNGGVPTGTAAWNGKFAEVEALTGGCSFPVRQRTRIPIRTGSAWSKIDTTRYIGKARVSGTAYQLSAEESVIHYAKDGVVVMVPNGLTNLAGSASVEDLGHFRLVGIAEFSGRNTTSFNESSAVPSLLVSQELLRDPQSNRQMFEPVRLSPSDLHILRVSSADSVSRSGPDWLTSPFGGVSITEEAFPDGTHPYRLITCQYDPERSGWTSALLVVEGGEVTRWEGIRGIRLGNGLWFTSVSKSGRFSLCAPVGTEVTVASRPTEDNLMEGGSPWEPPRKDLVLPNDFCLAVEADEVDTPAWFSKGGIRDKAKAKPYSLKETKEDAVETQKTTGYKVTREKVRELKVLPGPSTTV